MEELPEFFTRDLLAEDQGILFKEVYYRKKFYSAKLIAGLEDAMIPLFEIDSFDYSDDDQEKIEEVESDEFPEEQNEENPEFDPKTDFPDYKVVISVLSEFKSRGFKCGLVSDIDSETGSLLLFAKIR
jgi:hypothetical protein